MARRVRDAGGKVVDRDLKRNLSRAYGYATFTGDRPVPVTMPRQTFNREALAALAQAGPALDLAGLAARSPVDPAQVSSRDFLEAVFHPGECVVICKSRRDPGRIYRVGGRADWVGGLESPEGVFFLSNPVDGKARKNAEGVMSVRSEVNLTDFRHLVIESDEADAGIWIRAMAQVSLPIVAAYTSGGKSIHLLTRWMAPSKTAFLEVVEHLKPGLITYGADEAAMTAVRLTRLPGARRGDVEQRLLFLDPKADAVRVTERPLRGEL